MATDISPLNSMIAVTQSRRRFIASLTLSATVIPWLSGCSLSTARPSAVLCNLDSTPHERLAELERMTSGRIGVAAIDLSNHNVVMHRACERFAMCSTFKWILAALVLLKVDRRQESLSRTIRYTHDDLVYYSPVTKPRVSNLPKGDSAAMTVADLCHATMTTSDNTAANLLLETVGGPAGFNRQLRALGDQSTRLDRFEPELNENVPGDPRDTTTPEAMLVLMKRVLFGDVLLSGSKKTLRTWMTDNKTGGNRLRAGLPSNWISGDRTGTSENNASNNVAFSIAPNFDNQSHGPLLMVSFINAPNPFAAETDAVHASIANYLYSYFDSQA